MRGRGAFQLAQMRHRDPRIIELCDHLRAAVDLLERVASEPVEPAVEERSASVKVPATVALVQTDKLALSVRETRKLLGIGQTTIYRAMNEGKIPAVKFGKRTLIPTKGLRDWLDALPNR
jgi:excisionase family DNA binding protein